MVRIAGIPLLAVIAFSLAQHLAEIHGSVAGKWLCLLIHLVCAVWLAVTVHRMVLLEQPGSATSVDAGALRRIGLFLIATIVLWVVYVALKLGFMLGALNLFMGRYTKTGEAARELPLPFELFEYVGSWIPFFMLGRLSLVLPMLAIDGRTSLPQLWQLSRGNTWRLAVIIGVLPWLLDAFTQLLYRDGATAIELGLIVALGSVFIVIEVVALSLAYRELAPALTESAPPPTDPRA